MVGSTCCWLVEDKGAREFETVRSNAYKVHQLVSRMKKETKIFSVSALPLLPASLVASRSVPFLVTSSVKSAKCRRNTRSSCKRDYAPTTENRRK